MRLPRRRDYLIGSVPTVETLNMRNYLHDAAAIATLLALAVTFYTHLNPTCQPLHQPPAATLYAGR
ncbi:hypothetical protein [Pseudomonas brassicacearum]|uniref:hypothetical protein n=1 Tax=Pseudomonas brassicacearum TaxID=930166 RepID=UPI0012699E22|nr:hypothetical protein [Pseudomonas brassicacearum]